MQTASQIDFDLEHDEGYTTTYDAFVNGASLAELEAQIDTMRNTASDGWIWGAEAAIDSARDFINDW